MHPESIDEKTKRVLEKIAKTDLAKNFYLAGGTALAVHLGHRKSIDLDWFSKKGFSNSEIKKILSELGIFSLTGEEDGTVHGTLDGVKISFLRYNYELSFPLVEFENILLADERDISAMKIDAISSRGNKKDFVDLFFLLKKYSLEELIDLFEKKYKTIKYNKLHILKSLAYFPDAEDDPMPIMLENVKWEDMKEYISSETHSFLNILP